MSGDMRGPPDKTKAAGSGGSTAADDKQNRTDDCNATPPPPRDTTIRRRDPRRGRMTWITWWRTEQLGRTRAMSPAALGAYVRLLSEYVERQGPLPENDKLLSRIAGVSKRDWPGIRTELDDVYDVVDGHLVDAYAEREIARFRIRSARGTDNRTRRFAVMDGAGGGDR